MSNIKPGMVIDVEAYTDINGNPHYQEYKVLDWEAPKLKDGKWYFTAYCGDTDGISPMGVKAERIKIVRIPD